MIDVIIPTHNGLNTLEPVMNALVAAANGTGEHVHVIAVPNACSDSSAALVRSYSSRLHLTVLETGVGGKNRALNWALRESEGDLVVSLDDDVVISPDYLENLARLAGDCTDVSIFTGPIIPRYPRPLGRLRERFLSPHLRAVLFVEHVREMDGEVAPGLLYGPILSFRRAAVGPDPFDEGVGPDGTRTYAMGSETTFLRDQGNKGLRAYYSSSLEAQHLIAPEMMDWKFIFGRAQRYGRGQMRRTIVNNPKGRSRGRLSAFHAKAALSRGGSALAALLRAEAPAALQHLWWARYQIAMAEEFWAHARQVKSNQ